ncbi:indole-3-acetic acid-amido synthetase GH3.6-like [Lycium ferocissimum]|uniref:indole-3-acetic acid-amido synthetase GH3.6-like n=1 Tax=Lycium ferocissimum TaxID=112874 RepID=UPI002814C8E7|nr:indole-3-acetic acid-amido synthetase GH3.6-like [Lycium ferocissimum]
MGYFEFLPIHRNNRMFLWDQPEPFCKPSEVSYTLFPTMGYFEFLPIHRNNEVVDSLSISESHNERKEQQMVDLVDVKIGQEYELVITTYSRLYSYRVGDVLWVTGYKNNTPQFNFVRRENVILSIDSDKTDEFELQNAVKNAASNLMTFDARVTEHTPAMRILPPFQATMSYSGS